MHYYGLDDAGAISLATGSSVTFNSTPAYSPNTTICIAGVPSSVTITPSAVTSANCANTITGTTTLTSGGAAANLSFCSDQTTFGNGASTVNCARLTFPDSYTVNISTRFLGTYVIAVRGLANGTQLLVQTTYGNSATGYLPLGPALTQGYALVAGNYFNGGNLFGYLLQFPTWSRPDQNFTYFVGF